MDARDVTRRTERRVADFVNTHSLAYRPEALVVATSGGPDSLCLLYALNSLRESLGLNLHVAHLNHSLRGRESDDDAEFVAGVARALGLPCTIHKEDVKHRQGGHSSSIEEKAREARYDFLAKVARKTGAIGVATGHTADDQAETILLHILRGSGLSGLRGMRTVVSQRSLSGIEYTLLRPLLSVPRKETEAYCTAMGLEPRLDVSNLSTEMVRNRIRLELIPTLKEYNPNIEEALLRLSDSAEQDLEFIEEQVAEGWDAVAKDTDKGLRLNTQILSALSPSLQHHLARKALETVLGDLVDIEHAHIQSLVDLISKPAGKRIDLPRGVTAFVEYGECLITRGDLRGVSSGQMEGEQRLEVPGTTRAGGWEIRISVVETNGYTPSGADYEAALDADVVGEPLTIRSRRPGDRFQPLGLEGTKKLQDFFVDAKVPGRLRNQVPLVCSQEQVVWVVGHRIDERAKVTDSTRRVLLLEARRI